MKANHPNDVLVSEMTENYVHIVLQSETLMRVDYGVRATAGDRLFLICI